MADIEEIEGSQGQGAQAAGQTQAGQTQGQSQGGPGQTAPGTSQGGASQTAQGGEGQEGPPQLPLGLCDSPPFKTSPSVNMLPKSRPNLEPLPKIFKWQIIG